MNDKTINTEVTMRDAIPAGESKRFRVGDAILGRYVVESELGQGGMGVVYLCLDKVGGVKVAVKGLPPEVSHNSDEMESVRENFQLVSELQHPNIAGVRTLEKDARTGDYYLVMSYARGVSLKHWLRQYGGREHRAEQLKVLRQIASALDYAHNAEPRHIIHRDIKPENVMVDEGGNVMVLDFGLAAQVRSSMSRVSQVVTSRSGTPAYKSPEQWLAQVQRAPSDQYSLGVLAYQMFAGELPYDSDDIEILKHAVVFDPVPDIPGEGKAINMAFAQVLAKKPQGRFASCMSFVAALEGKQVAKRGDKHSRAFALFGVAAALALAASCVWWWQSGRSVAPQPPKPKPPEPSPVVDIKLSPVDEEVERRRLELAAESAAYALSVEMENAAQRIVAEQSDEVRAFFETEIHAFDKVRKAGDKAKADKSYVTATNFFVQAKAKVDELKQLVTARADCLKAKECAEAAKRSADAVGAKSSLALRYEEADKVLGEVASLAEKRDFAAASARAEAARGQFVALRTDVVKVTLDQAKRHQAAERWQECLVAAEKVLGWEPQNVEALSFKHTAHVHQLEITAKTQSAKEQWDELEKTLKELVAADTNNAVAIACGKKLENSRIRDDKDLCRRLQALCEIRPGDAFRNAKRRIYNFDFGDLEHYKENESLLADAIMVGGGLKAVRYLVEQRGFSPDETYGYNKESPLFAAVQADDLEVVRYLLAKGADVNRKEKFAGRVPIDNVKSIAVAEVLIVAGAKLDVVMMYDSGKKPFRIADGKDYELMRWLCAKGCSLTDEAHLFRRAAGAGDLEFLKSHVEEVKRFPDLILSAVGGGRMEVITWLESQGQSLSVVDKDGGTALHRCGGTNLTLAVYQYVYDKAGHRVTVADKKGQTPLHNAGCAEIARFLIDHGADVSARRDNGSTPLMDACYRGGVSLLELLVARGADVNVCNNDGFTALHAACQADNLAAVNFLLNKGANVDARNKNDMSALDISVNWVGDGELVKALVTKGTDINACDKDGHTPLMSAVSRNDIAMVRTLLAHRAKVDVLAKPGHGWRTPLTSATYGSDVQMAKLLLEYGADPVAVYREEDGREFYPLGGAFFTKNKEMFRLLVAHGADPYRMDSKGGNMFSLYDEEGKTFARFVLEETGVKKLGKSYEVASGVALDVALRLCEDGSKIVLKQGDYRALKHVEIRKSVTLQAEAGKPVTLAGVEVYAAKDGGDVDCALRGLSILPQKGVGMKVSGYDHDITIEIENCEIQSDDRALDTSWDVRQLVVRKCKLSGSAKYGAVYINDAKEGKTLDIEISDSEIRGAQWPAIHCGGKRSRTYFENCKFVGSVGADAAVNCGHAPCLFNDCTFSGGKMCVQHGGHSKFYNCTFVGRESDGNLMKVSRKLTENDFDRDK